MEGSYRWVSTAFAAIVLVLIIMIEAISACRFLKVEGSYKWVSSGSARLFIKQNNVMHHRNQVPNTLL